MADKQDTPAQNETVFTSESNVETQNEDNVKTPDAEPSAYDREQDTRLSQQDRELADRDQKIAELQSRLDAAAESDRVRAEAEKPAEYVAPTVNNFGQAVAHQPESAEFHEVPVPGTDAPVETQSGTGAAPTLTPESLSGLGDTDVHVQLPEFQRPDSTTEADIKSVKASLADIQTKVDEIHSFYKFAEANMPKLADALSKSPLASFLPKF